MSPKGKVKTVPKASVKAKAKKPQNAKPVQKKVAAPAAACVEVVSKSLFNPTVFRRFEEVASIASSTSPFFLSNNISINPGLSTAFPWLSGPAQAFNLYRFKYLRIKYLNSTNTTNSGLVVVGFNPDPNDLPPTTLQQIENYDTRLRVATWEDAHVDVPKSDLNRLNKFLLRNSIVPGALETYDIGSLYVVCSGNVANGVTIGEIWLDYMVEFYAPFVNIGTPPSAKANSVYQNISTNLVSGVGTIMTFPTVLANPMALVNTAGSFTGINGALIVYTQITLSAATLTAGALVILKNGAAVISAAYPPLNGGFSTMNAEAYVPLVPADILQIQVTATGTSLIASQTPTAQSILVINAA
jgi:hypothetical protein